MKYAFPKAVFLLLLIIAILTGFFVLRTRRGSYPMPSLMPEDEQASLSREGVVLGDSFMIGTPIEVSDIPIVRPEAFVRAAHAQAVYVDNGVQRNVTHAGRVINDVAFSPSRNKLGFFYYPLDNAISDIALVVMDIPQRITQEVYRKSVRTSGWEWQDEDHVIVYYNCGTACRYAFVIDALTGEQVDGYHVY